MATLARRMKLQDGQLAVVLNAPEGALQELEPLPFGVILSENGKIPADWILIFVKNQAELEKVLPKALKLFQPETLLWIAYPKKTSKIKTDFTRDTGWSFLQDKDLRWVTLVSFNEDWSAFAMRRYKPGEPRQTFV
ncbi:MAG TPA: hypothetical protein PKJ84_06120 [Anaerolineales bacterium]|nr:hypothetical protein [Anaerolineales bacterium]